MWQELPIRFGHAPDLPMTSPDAFLIYGAVPLIGGIGNDYTYETADNSLGAEPFGGAAVTTTTGARKVFFGTATKLYEWTGEIAGAVTDRSGTSYSASAAQTWSFAQFGDNTLAINLGNTLQRSTGGNFANVAGAPKGQIVVNAGFPSSPQIFVFGYDDGTNTPDGWYCSALSSDINWTEDYATFCAKGQLVEPVGPITAAVPFRDGVVVFKRNALFYGEFAPDGVNVIQWRRISGSVGCIGKNAVVGAEDAIYFANERGFYRFDGSYPQKLPGYVHEDWSTTCVALELATTSAKDRVAASYNPELSIVRWTTPFLDNVSVSLGYLHNIHSGLWTRFGAKDAVFDTHSAAVWAGWRYAATIAGALRRQGTTGAVAQVFTPLLGSPKSVTTLRGFWPTWRGGIKPGSAEYGPQNEIWIDSNGSVSFIGAKTPNAATTTGGNATASANGRADGVAQGHWVYARADIKMSSPWQFGSVSLDVAPR